MTVINIYVVDLTMQNSVVSYDVLAKNRPQ